MIIAETTLGASVGALDRAIGYYFARPQFRPIPIGPDAAILSSPGMIWRRRTPPDDTATAVHTLAGIGDDLGMAIVVFPDPAGVLITLALDSGDPNAPAAALTFWDELIAAIGILITPIAAYRPAPTPVAALTA